LGLFMLAVAAVEHLKEIPPVLVAQVVVVRAV
jgi:hypothetical protein